MLIDAAFPDAGEALPEMEMSLFVRPLFRPGEGRITAGAQAALQAMNVSPVLLLSLHLTGDWGEVSEEDRKANERAVASGGGRILSAHAVRGVRFCVVTEGDLSATTIALADES